jgi:hypothetical protein
MSYVIFHLLKLISMCNVNRVVEGIFLVVQYLFKKVLYQKTGKTL